MKNVTKIFAALLCVVTVIALSACGGKDNKNDTPQDTPAVTDTENEEKS